MGSLDATRIPEIAEENLLDGRLSEAELRILYRKLQLTRQAEERIREEYFDDEMKTPVHLGIGGEAISIGVNHCLPKGTKSFGTYRNHSLFLSVSEDTDKFFGELYGRVTGSGRGRAGSMHLAAPESGLMATSAVVGTTIPVAVGVALAASYRGMNDCVAVFFGDGAVEEGVFWESLNFACLRKLRLLFICEDNDLAIHTEKSFRRGFSSLISTVRTFNCCVDEGDGADLLGVVDKTRRMLARMAGQSSPGLLCFSYFRFLEHVGPNDDFDAGYRVCPTPQQRQEWDPVVRFEQTLRKYGWADDRLAKVRQEVGAQIDRSVAAAKRAPFPSSKELCEDVFS